MGKTYGRIFDFCFWGSNRQSSRNGFRIGLPVYCWSIYGAFVKPGPLVTVPSTLPRRSDRPEPGPPRPG